MTSHDPPPPAVPCGLQTLLALAAAEPVLTQALLRDRAAVVRASGIRLTAAEQAALDRTPDEALGRMLTALGPSLPDPQRRRLLKLAAATLAGLAAGGLVPGSPASGRPFVYQPIAEPLEHRPSRGVRPDDPRVQILLVKVRGGLTELQARHAVQRRSGLLVAIYRRAVLSRERRVTADVTATLGVSAEGAVTDVTGVKASPDEQVFRELVVAELRRIAFPRRASGRATVSLRLRFVPR